MAHLAPLRHRYYDANGEPLAGGKLYTYQAGTSTPLATYQNKAESISNTNPVILDANGEADVWIGSNAYKFVLKNSSDITQWTVDNISFLNDGVVTTAKLASGVLSADVDGRAKMADGYFAATTGSLAKFADGFLMANTTGLAKMADGFLAATTAGLAKMADGFLAASAAGRAKIADGFFAADSTSLAKFANGFLTADTTGRAKMADGFVTPAKLSSVNKTLSSSSSTFSTSSASMTAVTNLSAAITTIGRQVQISLQPDGSTSNAAGILASTGSDSQLQIKRGTTVIALFTIPVGVYVPPSAINFFDEPAAGTYTYTVEVVAIAAGSVHVVYTKLLVREL